MKKFVIFSAVAILVGVLLLRLLQHDAGYILIVGWGTTIEMRLGLALLLFFIAGVAWVFALREFKQFIGWLKRVVSHTAKRRQHKLTSAGEQGLYLLLQQDNSASQKQFLQAAKLSKSSSWHYLAAARCALDDGASDLAEMYLEQTEPLKDVDTLTLLLLKADVAIAQKRWDQGLMWLNKAKAQAPRSSAVLTRLQKVYEATADWHALEMLIAELERHKQLSKEHLRQLKERVAYQRLGAFGYELEQLANGERPRLEADINHYWQRLPKATKNSLKFIERYVQLLVLLDEQKKADALICTVLKTQWDSKLVTLYGALNKVDPKHQLNMAEHWAERHPDDSALQLALGRICLRSQLWGKAKDYFKRSLELNPAPEAYAELARLLAHLGEAEGSLEAYKRGLLLTAEHS